MRKIWILVIPGGLLFSCRNGPDNGEEVSLLNYSVTKVYPHDTTSFTEGFLVHDGELYESTGHTDQIAGSHSLFGVVNRTTGKIQPKVKLDDSKYFGEGITFLHDKVYQLTYTTRVGFVYDAKTFVKLGEFRFPGKEGWGMTTDGTWLILSDGSSSLYYLDPVSFRLVKTLRVTDGGAAADNLNELEFIHGALYANRYTHNYILRIDTADGKVLAKADLSSLDNAARIKYPGALEMNGIAYDSVQDKIYITGKLWPDIYEINFPH